MTLRIKNWEKFQHFKDRTPPWIKLYREILDDPDWHDLDGNTSKVLVSLWLVASEDKDCKGALPDTRKLAFRLRIKESELNQALAKLDHWLEQDDINVISDRYQSDAPERETEGETEGETEADETSAPSALHHQAALDGIHPAAQQTVASKKLVPECPHQEIIQLWGDKLPSAVQPRTWTGSRAAALKARWCEDRKRQNLEWWAGLFEHIGDSDFLMGRTSSHGRTPFMVSLDWLCKAENFAKTLDGQYDRKEPQAASLLVGAI